MPSNSNRPEDIQKALAAINDQPGTDPYTAGGTELVFNPKTMEIEVRPVGNSTSVTSPDELPLTQVAVEGFFQA